MTRALFFAALCVLFVTPPPALAQRTHVDKLHGYAVTPPVKWTKVPVKLEEKWIVAKWLSNRKYDNRKTGYVHQPLMRVIRFAPKTTKTEGGKKKELKAGDSILLSSPYKDYKDYLKRNFRGGGFFISKEQNTKIGKTPVTIMEVKIEKLATSGKKRIFVWVFKPAWGGELVIECDCFEVVVAKVQPIVMSAFKTFRVIKRDLSLVKKGEGIETGARIKIVKNETPAQQKKRRQKLEKMIYKKAIADLPGGWTHRRTRHFLILNHGKPKFMNRVIAHAEAVRTWLDINFKDVGTGYVQGSIIRICKNKDEERAFSKGSGDAWSADTRESVVSQDVEYSTAGEFSYLAKAVMQSWFHDKNEDLYSSMPVWLDRGLSQYIGSAVMKGRRLVFKEGESEKTNMKEALKLNKLMPVKEMFEMTSKDLWSGKDVYYRYAQCASLMRYLWGPGRRSKKTRGLIKNYIKHLLTQLKENEEAARKSIKSSSSSSKPMTEEEEEEALKQRKKQDWSAKEKEFLQQVFKKTFKGWNAKHWAGLQANYTYFAKSKKK